MERTCGWGHVHPDRIDLECTGEDTCKPVLAYDNYGRWKTDLAFITPACATLGLRCTGGWSREHAPPGAWTIAPPVRCRNLTLELTECHSNADVVRKLPATLRATLDFMDRVLLGYVYNNQPQCLKPVGT